MTDLSEKYFLVISHEVPRKPLFGDLLPRLQNYDDPLEDPKIDW